MSSPAVTSKGATPPKQQKPKLTDVGKSSAEFERHVLTGVEYRQYPQMVCAVSRDGEPYEILSGRLAVPVVTELRDVTTDLTPGTLEDTSFQVEYTTPSNSLNTARVGARDMRERNPHWPSALGIDGRVSPKRLDSIATAIKALGATLERRSGWTQAFAATGLLRPAKGTPVFLRLGLPALTATGVDPRHLCELPPGIGEFPGVKVLTLDDPSPATFQDDLCHMLSFLDVYPSNPAVAWAMLGQLALAPWSSLPGVGRVALVTAGDTGIGKSAIAGILTAAQSRSFTPTEELAHCATTGVRHAKASKIGIDRVLYPLNGMLTVVDDFFAGKLTRRDIDDQWRLMSSIGDSAATGSGGVKGSREGVGIRVDRFPRSCVLANAENLPEEAERGSEVARYVAVRMEEDTNWKALTECQSNPRAFSRAHATMIQRGLADLDAPLKAIGWARERVAGWKVGGHNRARQGYMQILAGVKLLCDHVQEALFLDGGLLADAEEALQAAAAAQALRVGMVGGRQIARDPVRLFCKHFREMLAGDPWWLAASELDKGSTTTTYRPPAIPGHSPAAVGWRQTGTSGDNYEAGWQAIGKSSPLGSVTVRADGSRGRAPWRPVVLTLPATAWDRLAELVSRRVRDHDGWSLPAPDGLKDALHKAGWFRTAESEPAPVWSGGARTRVLRFDLGRLLDGDDGLGDDGDPGDPGEPEPEPSPDPETPVSAPETPATGPTPAEPEQFELGLFGLDDDSDPEMVRAVGLLASAFPGLEVIPEPVRKSAVRVPRKPAETAVEPVKPAALVTAPAGRVPSPRGEQGSRGKASRRIRAAALDDAGLWLPGQAEPVVVEVPGSLGAAYELASAHGLKALYLMPAYAEALGLPAEVDGGKGQGVDHEWASLPESLTADPSGRLSRWMNVWQAGSERKATGRAVVAVWLDDDYADNGGRFPDGQTFVQALSLFAEATGAEWYMGAPILARQFATAGNKRRRNGPLQRCEAVATETVPAVAEYGQPGLANLVKSTSRVLTAAELEWATVLHRFDRNAAFPTVYEGLTLGIGEPEHRENPVFDAAMPGYWRCSRPIGTVTPDGVVAIPAELAALLRLDDGDGRGVWLTTPEASLFAELGVLPELSEAWVWPTTEGSGAFVRPLASVGKRLRLAREQLQQGGSPAHRYALSLVKQIGSALSGVVNEQARTGDRRDWMWRPDWRHFIRAASAANMVRELVKVGRDTNRWPCASHIDAVYFASDSVDPEIAIPRGMRLQKTGGGNWKPEAWVTVAVIKEHMGERSFHKTVRQITGKGE